MLDLELEWTVGEGTGPYPSPLLALIVIHPPLEIISFSARHPTTVKSKR